MEGLRVRRGDRDILRGVAFAVERGSIVALMGLSGGGKTTVLRAIAALEPFDAGRIAVGDLAFHPGESTSKRVLRELPRRVGIVFQFHCLFEHLTALENVTLAPVHAGGVSRQAAEKTAMALLESLGVVHRSDALPRALSGGEAQRVAIARAMAMNPPLLLMDEPTASLDPGRRLELGRTLRDLATGGRTLLIATHDADFAREFATHALILAGGEVVESGPAREVLDSPAHPATREFLQSEKSTVPR